MKTRISKYALVSVIALCALIITVLRTQPPLYFASMQTSSDVRNHILTVFTIDETTFSDIRESVENEIFGPYFYCKRNINSFDNLTTESGIVLCEEPKARIGWWYTSVFFVFENGILVDLDVSETYRGL